MSAGPNGSEDRLMESVRAAVTLPRLEIVEQTDDAYSVRFGEREYRITKGAQSYVALNASSYSGHIRLVMQPRSDGYYIEQAEDVPQEFKEVMMVHEIRELEYRSAGMDNPHDRAVHDETLYVLKHLPAPIQSLYFEFARKYRLAAQQAEPQGDERRP